MNVLILSRSENTHADAVESWLKKRKISVSRINFDFKLIEEKKFPQIILGNTKSHPDAIFVHHPRIDYRADWFMDNLEQKLFMASWNSVQEWMEAQFYETLWVNKPSANLRSRNVLYQLQIAKSVGFRTPDTLFTNDIAELKLFARDAIVVIKQGNLGVHMDKQRILTSIIDVNSIEDYTLRNCPCLFQKYIEKSFELRIHVIRDAVLSCKIDSQASDKTRVDWRNYDLHNTPHTPYILNETLRTQCISLVENMGLAFGVIDAIITPQNEFVFLECNAQGHWLWIEQLTNLPITNNLCELLISGLR